MDEYTVIAIFCLLDDLAKSMGLREPCERMTTSEVALVGIIASVWFGKSHLLQALSAKVIYPKHVKHESIGA